MSITCKKNGKFERSKTWFFSEQLLNFTGKPGFLTSRRPVCPSAGARAARRQNFWGSPPTNPDRWKTQRFNNRYSF